MPTNHRKELAKIRRFDQLIAYLRDEMGWPIKRDSFDDVDDLFYDFTPEELGIDSKNAAKIQEIKRLRPLSTNQPWGIFFVKFEPKLLPVGALRRILSQVAVKKRASANSAERAAWSADDLLFVSNYGEGPSRQISFAHFSQSAVKKDLPTLKVLGWNNLDTALHLDDVSDKLTHLLAWPDDEHDAEKWRKTWRSAFTLEHREVINTSKKLSVELAKLARNIRDRIITVLKIETEEGPVSKLMAAFKEALVHDLDEDGFADMYAQTIAYGLLSARVANPSGGTADDFAAAMPVTNPFLKELMETFLDVGGRQGRTGSGMGLDFDELGVSDVVDLLNAPETQMDAVLRDFGDRNPQEDPVIHFFEGFLQEYDKNIRKARGVFYTPRPVVSFIVRSVDQILRTEFGLQDGLADVTNWGEMAERLDECEIPEGTSSDQAFVQILDPATGTGTFLVEVIGLIHKTMTDKWSIDGHDAKKIGQLWNDYVPIHLLPRLHGYELMMAPYAIAHMKIGLKLYETGYRFGSDERAQVYLTNSLEPAQDFSGTFEFAIPALAHEANAVNIVKETRRFTVVIGNPPYAGHSLNNQVEWIVDKVYDYKRGYPDLQKPGQAKWLQDDYVKFFRLSTHLLSLSNTGILALISNHAYLENPTFRGMRQKLWESASDAFFLDLHGNTKRKEVSPDGRRDENVFDIQQGVAISILVFLHDHPARVHHADLWGSRAEKYPSLLTESALELPWEIVRPKSPHFAFVPTEAALDDEFDQGWSIKDVFALSGDPAPGIVTTHDQFAIAFTKSEMKENISSLIGSNSEKDARQLFRLCTQKQWNYDEAKRELRKGEWADELVPVMYRPFDYRWTVYNSHVAVHRRDRIMRHMRRGKNLGLISTRSIETGRGFEHVFCTRSLIQHHTVSIKEVNYLFPLFIEPHSEGLGIETERRPNLDRSFCSALNEVLESAGKKDATPEQVFGFVYAILYSQSYRDRFQDCLRREFARVPIPGSASIFSNLADLGKQLVEYHLLEAKFPREARPTITGNGPFLVEKTSWSDETVWIDRARTMGFRGVPERVWTFHIGGYQICEKWLTDRQAKGGKKAHPGRVLTDEDIDHYQKIVVALSETTRIIDEIDEAIDRHGGWPDAFRHEPSSHSSGLKSGQQDLLKVAEDEAPYDDTNE